MLAQFLPPAMDRYCAVVFCAAGVTTVFLTAGVTGGAGVLATAGDGFTVLVVVADFMTAPGAATAVVVAL